MQCGDDLLYLGWAQLLTYDPTLRSPALFRPNVLGVGLGRQRQVFQEVGASGRQVLQELEIPRRGTPERQGFQEVRFYRK